MSPKQNSDVARKLLSDLLAQRLDLNEHLRPESSIANTPPTWDDGLLRRERRAGMRFFLSDPLPTLLLTFPAGDSNEYRVRQGCVEFRANQGTWHALDEPDLQLHFALNTEVAKWLQQTNSLRARPPGSHRA